MTVPSLLDGMSWCRDLGALLCAAKDRDLSAADHNAAINEAHTALFSRLGDMDSEIADMAKRLEAAEMDAAGLRQAIRVHRDQFPDEALDGDVALWSILDDAATQEGEG